MLKVVIVEDEKMTILDLQDTLRRIDGDIEVVACLTSIAEAIEFFKSTANYDLIFSDIQLTDGSSFEIYKKITIEKPIIFCTAFDEYALEAFQTNGIDYLLKPFNKNSVSKALDKYNILKAGFEQNKGHLENLLNMVLPQSQDKISSVLVYQGDKIIPLNKDHIAFFGLENEHVFATTLAGDVYNVNIPLDELEQNFSPQFFRVNRQYLISRKAIKDVSQYFNRKLLVNFTLPSGTPILVGKLRRTAFLEWLAKY